ncbi:MULTISPECIES: carboxypeptidase-like regulatory domain-containing protein [Halomonadaceae]|uniref:carboxypeptidase-like regulatory domain-containing protein n=1 Tax=Halomonadaceae TaxID=28256 RepID=UPI0015976A01|nr:MULTISPECIES: carboxypeptidase-like regulatory domain-containing protein [Halomonas]QJQ94207.1 carboxypeptidase regulatory-like domain-containing protein [Halomonas sp. PA5]
MKYWIVLLAVSVVVSGCQIVDPAPSPRIDVIDIGEDAAPEDRVTPGRVAREVAFPEREYAALEKQGNAAITGRLTLNGSAGSNANVAVAPVTTYSAEAAEKALAGQAVEPADPRAQAFTRQTRTNADGNFTVNGLPAGEYYVSASITPPGGQPRVVINQVRVGAGQTVRVNLSR